MLYFTPYEKSGGKDGRINYRGGLDYSFKNGIYLMGSYLFNSDGMKSLSFKFRIFYCQLRDCLPETSCHIKFSNSSFYLYPATTGMRLYAWNTNPIFLSRKSISLLSFILVMSVSARMTFPSVG